MAVIYLLLILSHFGVLVKTTQDSEGYFSYCSAVFVRLSCSYDVIPYQLFIDDVIYGSFQNLCGSTVASNCSVGNSTGIVRSFCAGKSSCSILLSSATFGTDCGTQNITSRVKFSCVLGPTSEDDVITDGWWNTWSDWGACDVTCGGGTKERSRLCDNPAPKNTGNNCTGPSTSTTTCNTNICQETTTTTTTGTCCQCSTSSNDNVTDEEIQEKIEEIQAKLYINKRELSSAVRKKTSAKDDRPTSVAVGSVAIVILSIVIIGVIGMDIKRFYDGAKRLLNVTIKYCKRGRYKKCKQ